MQSPKEISALIHLLDDPDSEVYQHVEGKLMQYGKQVVPNLETAWEESFDPVMQERIELVIHKINFDHLKAEFGRWVQTETHDLLEAALIINRYQYHDLNEQVLRDQVERYRRAIWLELNFNLTPLEQVNVFNHVFYTMLGFSGKPPAQNSASGFYLNNVLDSKTGNPVSLGLVYLIIAQQLDLPMYGVKLPQFFVLSYLKNFVEHLPETEDYRRFVLFYVNALNKGTIFTRNEIKQYLRRMQLPQDEQYFSPCTNTQVIGILLDAMIQAYQNESAFEKVKELKELRELLN